MQLTIIGLGAIGGTFAIELKDNPHYQVYGVDIDPDTIEKTKAEGYILDGSMEAGDFISQADIVLITLYPKQVTSFVEEYKSQLKEGAILTDVTGIKTHLIKEIRPLLDDSFDFIFAHPMRGSEKAGFAGAEGGKFENANALITPIPENKEKNIQIIEDLYRAVGFSLLTRVDPKLHDQQIAYVSQLMHALSVAAVNSAESREDTMLFAGNSFQELTRIADINVPLWTQLFMGNREALIESIDNFDLELQKIRQALADDDPETLSQLFNESRRQRREWY